MCSASTKCPLSCTLNKDETPELLIYSDFWEERD